LGSDYGEAQPSSGFFSSAAISRLNSWNIASAAAVALLRCDVEMGMMRSLGDDRRPAAGIP
jgi:hypothetical protein